MLNTFSNCSLTIPTVHIQVLHKK